MLIPLHVDVPMFRWPISNFVLIAAISVVSIYGFLVMGRSDFGPLEPMVLDGWSLNGMIGHMFVHADVIHLFGNMLFLWVFGNAVCAKIGNLWYPLFFLLLGLLSAMTHNVLDGSPGIGASGAINGVVGAFVILYPLNEVRCALLLGVSFPVIDLSSMWVIGAFLLFDIYGAVTDSAGVAYWAHLGGFAVGAGVMLALVASRVITMHQSERSLLDVWGEGGA